MTASNMVSVIVAICFVVFIGLGKTSLLYYAAKLSDSGQGNGDWKVQGLRQSGSWVLRFRAQLPFDQDDHQDRHQCDRQDEGKTNGERRQSESSGTRVLRESADGFSLEPDKNDDVILRVSQPKNEQGLEFLHVCRIVVSEVITPKCYARIPANGFV
jgi:hypothetical protein